MLFCAKNDVSTVMLHLSKLFMFWFYDLFLSMVYSTVFISITYTSHQLF